MADQLEAAYAALDAHNRDGAANPFDGLALAGRVIRHQAAALEAVRDLTTWAVRDGATRATLIRGITAALDGDTNA